MAKRLRIDVADYQERDSPETKRKALSDDVGEDILAWLFVDDGVAKELAELLAGAVNTDEAGERAAVRFAEDPYRPSPESELQITSSSYVTINGNDETCGSSFSDWSSSVMASVDVAGIIRFSDELPATDLAGASSSGVEDDGALEWRGGDEALARFIDEVFSEQSSLT